MDLYDLAKEVGADIIIRYNHETGEFSAELENLCTADGLYDCVGLGKCRKEALTNLVDFLKGNEVMGDGPQDISVPNDLVLPSGL